MDLIAKVLEQVVSALQAQNLLDLVPQATPELVAAELREQVRSAGGQAAHLGPFLSQALCNSPYVDELYADDATLIALVNDAPG